MYFLLITDHFLRRNTNEVVLRNRIPQSRNMKRPSSWGGISSKNPFLDYQINFQNDSAKQGIQLLFSSFWINFTLFLFYTFLYPVVKLLAGICV